MAVTVRRLGALGWTAGTHFVDRTRTVRARARSINANLGRRNDERLAVVRRINGELAAIAERVVRAGRRGGQQRDVRAAGGG
jgi:hypothetical protein